MRARWLAGAAAVSAALAAVSCGEVPTLENGIAYISPVVLPSPAMGVNDTLRDSLGVAAPLRIRAFDRGGNEIPGVQATFLVVPVDTTVALDANGILRSKNDSVHSVQIVGRVGDRLQTNPATLLVVPRPDSIAPGAGVAADTTVTLPALRAMPVLVTGLYRGTRTPVNGIVVRYQIDSVRGSSPGSASAVLASASGTISRPDSTVAVDTTKSGGVASRTLILAGSGVSAVYLTARARGLDGRPLRGSPTRFVVRVAP